MKKYFCLAVNGLHEELFANPLGQLANYLNVSSPAGVHFNVVGGMDPRPFINQFIHNCAAAAGAGYSIIMIGHSLGSMMMFYLADAMKLRGITIPLVVAIDATDWGTNAPNTFPYAMGTAMAGHYWVPDNVDRFIYYRQPVYPGGGVATLATNNTHTQFEPYERVEAHVVLPILPDIQRHILKAVLETTK